MRAIVLDDAELNNLLMLEALRPIAGCRPESFTRPADALACAAAHTDEIGIVLTDYEMPGMDGLAVIRGLRALPGFAHVPIVMVTSFDQRALRRAALEAGATDFVNKPVDPVEIRARVTNLLALRRAHKAEAAQSARLAEEVAAAVALVEAREREIVTVLMRAAEHRDTDTGDHVARVANYTVLIAEALGLPPDQCRLISLASTMHDVGKIAIPDAILLKPGPLSTEERREMERHAERGARILANSSSDVVRLAAEIAVSHHERWDGTGYPNGLAGPAIPLAGRIVAVADVFDALTSDRPYKRAWTLEAAHAFLLRESGAHFDPAVVEAFLSRWDAVADLVGQAASRAA
ncbi:MULTISPECIES: HD domain-containing phosphohydrolase [Methylobacterium]|jgi:putative two-component system response regulator|uniref:HD-GYP domain-containing protein n=1 Tax=Methylobacterium TaxID=407 RepID=UPI0008F1B927|nr:MULTISPECIES: HD domain-containing phosphohydrolase [Methylobacterium]MBZ6414337.1 response regulator [Methylobacterium sp.]MBK3400314.1 response regulator [Methylobacterium ajmalii]MBK3412528.1 response regulator [Methylobacterium ajmalii]MBK3422563.1 response regulator [Methylobacterium ajmalii]SFF73082.1 putative two-component system response regulator [Methylobacterium sp. yr596]